MKKGAVAGRGFNLEQAEQKSLFTDFNAEQKESDSVQTESSTFSARNALHDDAMSSMKKLHVGVINWGFVAGKSQTYYPWDSWQHPYSKPPDPWFHDILKTDGTPYRQSEVD